MRLIAPLRAFWPNLRERRQLVAEYQQLGRMRILLADIAKRGGIFSAGPRQPDLYAAGVAEGRRQIALELIRTSGLEPAELQKACTDPIPVDHRRPSHHPGGVTYVDP
ncbi:Bbp19 family protein [Bosea minatitlanensis]|uniref:Bbp19-like phage domain-containing protein n=1 Tax=Bosea minatitlanensis TaxID=128782 RepID=A0ABW0EXP8_9HYPH|nr:hypothetical protein [Bosea minatitlanensis]MCT4495393.1 hypothetical protein [Bosea minatitlanensis]